MQVRIMNGQRRQQMLSPLPPAAAQTAWS